MNETLAYTGLKIETNTEYTPDSLEAILSRYDFVCHIDENAFICGRGHRKSLEQRVYVKVKRMLSKNFAEFMERTGVCGPEQNSYAKPSGDVNLMRIKKDYMGNDQLLPAYNIRIGVADEYVAVADVMQYRSDMDCFVPLMEKFHELYGFSARYPVAEIQDLASSITICSVRSMGWKNS